MNTPLTTTDDRVRAKIDLIRHALVFVVVNAFMFGLDWMQNQRIDWAYWSLLGWGLGLASHAVSVFTRSTWLASHVLASEQKRDEL